LRRKKSSSPGRAFGDSEGISPKGHLNGFSEDVGRLPITVTSGNEKPAPKRSSLTY